MSNDFNILDSPGIASIIKRTTGPVEATSSIETTLFEYTFLPNELSDNSIIKIKYTSWTNSLATTIRLKANGINLVSDGQVDISEGYGYFLIIGNTILDPAICIVINDDSEANTRLNPLTLSLSDGFILEFTVDMAFLNKRFRLDQLFMEVYK